MGFLSNFKKNIQSVKREKSAQMNGKRLKELLKNSKKNETEWKKRQEVDRRLIKVHKCLCKKF